MHSKILAWILEGDEKIKIDKIALIGMRGSGKSTLGIHLARELDWKFTDSDEEVEKKWGIKIKEIFAREGEEVFRTKEREILLRLSTQSPLVLATGGGIVEKTANRTLLKKNYFCIWLETDTEVLQQRLRKQKRPPLTSLDFAREIEELCRRREPLYRECCSIKVNTSKMKVEELTDVVKYIWSRF